MQIFCSKVYMRFCAIILFFSCAVAQAQTNSVYSRYALGDLQPDQTVHTLGMGGACIADNNPLHINYINPASYASSNKVTMQFAMYAERFNVRTLNSLAVPTGTTNINYLNLAMPIIKNKMGLSVGFLPKTRVNYTLRTKQNITEQDTLSKEFYGEGGMQAIYVGTGYKYKDLSLGINTNINFGNFQNNLASYFGGNSFALPFEKTVNKKVMGVNFDIGAQYALKLNNKNNLKLGLIYTTNTNLTSNQYNVTRTVNTTLNGVDSFEYDSLDGKIFFPGKLGGGLVWETTNNIKVAIDYTAGRWASYRIFGANDSTANNGMLRVGLSYVPEAGTSKSIFKRMEYKIGGYSGTDIIRLKGEQLKVNAFTLGTTIPMRRRNNAIAVFTTSLQVGSRGTTDNGLFRENFTRLNLGITFNDTWFLKYKYD
jgi:hypothetical protein